jgi:hypothetical protein
MTASVVPVHDSQSALAPPPAASSKLDLHAWIAIGCATIAASGILSLVFIAYAKVP